MKPDAAYEQLHIAVEALKPYTVPFSGTMYRVCSYKYATRKDLLSGRGSLMHGARYNAKKSFPAVYLAAAPETALAEYLGNWKDAGIPVNRDNLPCVLIDVEVSVKKLVDLADNTVLHRLEISETGLFCDWKTENDTLCREAFTQSLGRALYMSGYEGCRYPSVQCRGIYNYVFFPDNFSGNSFCRIVNSGRLPEQ